MKKDIKKIFTNFKPYISGHEYMFKSSVLIPILNINSTPNIVFQVRSKNLKHQPGEISFPGGKIEEGETPLNCVIRETCEELGLTPDDIEIISPLHLFVTPHNIIINPFLGFIKNINKININKDEVDKLFFVPLNFFLENEPTIYTSTVKLIPSDDFPYDDIPNGKNYNFRQSKYYVHFYKYNEYVIWGFTARILKDFIDELKKFNL